MSFAQPGQLLVSRSFYEVVSCLSLDYASLSATSARAPTSTCASTRCTRSASAPTLRAACSRPARSASRRAARRRGFIGELTDARPFGMHRMALLGAPLAFALLVGSGVAVRAQMRPPPTALPAPTAAAKPVMKPATEARIEPTTAAKAALIAAAKPEPEPAAKAEQPAEPSKDRRPADPEEEVRRQGDTHPDRGGKTRTRAGAGTGAAAGPGGRRGRHSARHPAMGRSVRGRQEPRRQPAAAHDRVAARLARSRSTQHLLPRPTSSASKFAPASRSVSGTSFADLPSRWYLPPHRTGQRSSKGYAV